MRPAVLLPDPVDGGSVAVKIMATLLAAQLVIVIVAMLAVAGLRSVDDGAGHLNGRARASAFDALRRAQRACSDEPGQHIANRRWRVVELEIIEDQAEGGPSSQEALPDYRTKLQAYTLFCIPTITIEVDPSGGTSCVEGLEDHS